MGTAKRRLTPAEYTKLADSYADEPPRADEALSIEINPAVLRMGRPTKNAPAAGKTPALPVRLPTAIRTEIAHRVNTGESNSASELVRTALVEYFDNHPARNG